MTDVVQRIEESVQTRAYGRGDHLKGISRSRSGMLTVERLTEVEWTLGKLQDARNAVGKLLDGEPAVQPPSDRSVAMRRIESELAGLEDALEELFS